MFPGQALQTPHLCQRAKSMKRQWHRLCSRPGCSNHVRQGQSTAGRKNEERPISADVPLPTTLASVVPEMSAHPSSVSLGLSLEKRRMRRAGWITTLSHTEFPSIYHTVSKRRYLSRIRCSKTKPTCPKTNVRFEVVWICIRAGFSGEGEVTGIIPYLGP